MMLINWLFLTRFLHLWRDALQIYLDSHRFSSPLHSWPFSDHLHPYPNHFLVPTEFLHFRSEHPLSHFNWSGILFHHHLLLVFRSVLPWLQLFEWFLHLFFQLFLLAFPHSSQSVSGLILWRCSILIRFWCFYPLFVFCHRWLEWIIFHFR